MACSERMVEEKFIFYWKIKNLRYSTLQTGEFFRSPDFTLENFQNTKWRLDLHPKGTKEYSDYVSLYLTRENDSGPETVDIKCDIKCHVKGAYLDKVLSFGQTFKKNDACRFPAFLSNKCILPESTVFIICSMCYNGSSTSKPLSSIEDFLSSILKLNPQNITSSDKLKEQADNKNARTDRQLFARPKRCFALSEFFTYTKYVEFPVDFSILSESEFTHVIPVAFAQAEFSLVVILEQSQEFIHVSMQLLHEGFYESLIVVCQLFLLINETYSTVLFNDSHEFNGNEKIWFSDKPFELCNLKTKLKDVVPDMAKWKFEFIFSNGEVHSTIVKEYCDAEFDDAPIHSGLVSNQLEGDKTVCDVVLKVNDKTFHANKDILSRISPVFASMFTQDTVESRTNTVRIKDLDEDVVRDLISFINTGTLNTIEFTSVKQLFIAADKYQMLVLKKMCRNFLIDNLTWKNACSVLSLADSHNDSKLENAAVDVISFYIDVILVSDDWEQLETDNMGLANKFLKAFLKTDLS